MIIEHLMKLDIILKNVGCTVTKMLDHNKTEKLNTKKNSIEGSIRDHLRGFSRTIPAFLMAYGGECIINCVSKTPAV